METKYINEDLMINNSYFFIGTLIVVSTAIILTKLLL